MGAGSSAKRNGEYGNRLNVVLKFLLLLKVSPAVYESVSRMQVLGIDKTDKVTTDLESQSGLQLHISPSTGKIAATQRKSKVSVHFDISIVLIINITHYLKIALVTCDTLAKLSAEDVLLCNALTGYGCAVSAVVWNAANVDWSAW
jgi:hypothetical protein